MAIQSDVYPGRKTIKNPGEAPGPKTTKDPGQAPGRKTTKDPGQAPGQKAIQGPRPGPGPGQSLQDPGHLPRLPPPLGPPLQPARNSNWTLFLLLLTNLVLHWNCVLMRTVKFINPLDS